jgi:hypothetical protein
MRAGPAALALLLTACASGGSPTPEPAERIGAVFVPDERGLAVMGSVQRIDFGRSPQGTITVLNRELGKGRTVALAGCPVGVVQQLAWDDLVLTFSDERFVGWSTGGARAGQTCA